jgi:hypothetical protein
MRFAMHSKEHIRCSKNLSDKRSRGCLVPVHGVADRINPVYFTRRTETGRPGRDRWRMLVQYLWIFSIFTFVQIYICDLPGSVADSSYPERYERLQASLPQSEAETMCWPSGENATDLTGSVCPVKVPGTVSSAMAFHT